MGRIWKDGWAESRSFSRSNTRTIDNEVRNFRAKANTFFETEPRATSQVLF
jgi:hypothetical protein